MTVGDIFVDKNNSYYVKIWGDDYLSLINLNKVTSSELKGDIKNIQEVFENLTNKIEDNYRNGIEIEKGDYVEYIAEDANERFSGIVYQCTDKGFDLIGDNWNSLFICADSKNGEVVQKIIKRKELLHMLDLIRKND